MVVRDESRAPFLGWAKGRSGIGVNSEMRAGVDAGAVTVGGGGGDVVYG
jgi:hypothetical protein